MFEKGINKATSKNFSLGRLRSLVRVKRAGYIRKAANYNDSIASMISDDITNLEMFFGKVSLRSKDGRLVGLSDDGLELANIAETFLTSMQNFQDRIDGVEPNIVIGAGETFLTNVLLPKFDKLKDSSSGNRIRLSNMRSSDLPDALDRGEVDLIIVSEKRLNKKHIKRVLGKVEYKLYAPAHRWDLSKYSKSRLDMISELPFATLSGHGERKTFVENLMAEKGKTPTNELECSSSVEVLEAVRSGCFCAILPTFLGQSLSQKDFMRFQIDALKEMHGKLCIAWRKETINFKHEIEQVALSIQKIVKEKLTTKG